MIKQGFELMFGSALGHASQLLLTKIPPAGMRFDTSPVALVERIVPAWTTFVLRPLYWRYRN